MEGRSGGGGSGCILSKMGPGGHVRKSTMAIDRSSSPKIKNRKRKNAFSSSGLEKRRLVAASDGDGSENDNYSKINEDLLEPNFQIDGDPSMENLRVDCFGLTDKTIVDMVDVPLRFRKKWALDNIPPEKIWTDY